MAGEGLAVRGHDVRVVPGSKGATRSPAGAGGTGGSSVDRSRSMSLTVADRRVPGRAHQRRPRRHRVVDPDQDLAGDVRVPLARAARRPRSSPRRAAGGRGRRPRRAGCTPPSSQTRSTSRTVEALRTRPSPRRTVPVDRDAGCPGRRRWSGRPGRRRDRTRRSSPRSGRPPRCRRAAPAGPGASAPVSARSVTVSTRRRTERSRPNYRWPPARLTTRSATAIASATPMKTTMSSSPSRTAVSKSPRVSASRA